MRPTYDRLRVYGVWGHHLCERFVGLVQLSYGIQAWLSHWSENFSQTNMRRYRYLSDWATYKNAAPAVNLATAGNLMGLSIRNVDLLPSVFR